MQRTSPFEAVSQVEMILDDGRRVGVMAHTACAVRKGLVQLSVPTPADPVRDAFEIETERCAVCKRRLWKETDDGERVQHAEASGHRGQSQEGGEEEDDERREGRPPVQGPALHGLERTGMPEYRAKAIHIDAEQIIGRQVNVSTRRGLITARDGDWVIHDALGVAEVLDGEAFSKRYELVPEEDLATPTERHEPDPRTPRNAPREDVQFPEHLQSYLTGESTEMPDTGAPGDRDLTDQEAREAAKAPDEQPVVGSAVEVQGPEPRASQPKRWELGYGDQVTREPPKEDAPKNRGGRPKGSGTQHYGH